MPDRRSPTAAILAANAGRDPALVRRKYSAMAADAFAFFRGTSHLFYADWTSRSAPDRRPGAPPAWISGDLHAENFGAYRGADGLAHFDVNDFDDAALAPASWELARMATSILVAGSTLGLADAEADTALHSFLDTYVSTLAAGLPTSVDDTTASGSAARLLASVEARSGERADAAELEKRTLVTAAGRRLRTDTGRVIALDRAARDAVLASLRAWAATTAMPAYYEPLDVATRIAGTASLGLPRYVVLARGTGDPDGDALLDVKAARPSPVAQLASRTGVAQPAWRSEATRVASVQARLQATPPPLLQPLAVGDASFVVRALQPSDDRIHVADWAGHAKRMLGALTTMGTVAASSLLRGAGWHGAATPVALRAWAGDARGIDAIAAWAHQYLPFVVADWAVFATDVASGVLDAPPRI